VGSFEGFTQSNKTLRTCFSFCRSYCNSSWKLSRGISQIKLSEIFESYLKFFEIIGRKCLPFIIDVQAHVFKSKSGACAAFLANYNPRSYATVSFGNQHYNLPPWSVSILPNCKHTVYNTARVRTKLNKLLFLMTK
jgi:hypothetical protein